MAGQSGKESATIRHIINLGYDALVSTAHDLNGSPPTAVGGSHWRIRTASNERFTSSVEEAVISRDERAAMRQKELPQAPDPRLEVLRNAVKNPLAQQAMISQLGLTDGKPKSRAEIARDMNISEIEVDALINSGIEDLRGPKEA